VELSEKDLENVLAGNTQGMSEKIAQEHPDLFRDKSLEDLKQLREDILYSPEPDNCIPEGKSK